uniref:Zinc finger Ran-binding domain-containing protein 2 n=1 Tax=Magallana gigas TaxID=29159 RepID=K1S517_MAGGI
MIGMASDAMAVLLVISVMPAMIRQGVENSSQMRAIGSAQTQTCTMSQTIQLSDPWILVCGNVNFSRRNECNRCGKDRKEGIVYKKGGTDTGNQSAEKKRKDGTVFKKGGTEIGKQLAEKSKGLFSADDWQCKSCANVNWARRMTCNVCNAPKYGKQEQRTGFGGGFMERDEIVEYKERIEEDDDEYDEVGKIVFIDVTVWKEEEEIQRVHGGESCAPRPTKPPTPSTTRAGYPEVLRLARLAPPPPDHLGHPDLDPVQAPDPGLDPVVTREDGLGQGNG